MKLHKTHPYLIFGHFTSHRRHFINVLNRKAGKKKLHKPHFFKNHVMMVVKYFSLWLILFYHIYIVFLSSFRAFPR